MPEIGNSLREARIRLGMGVKDVENATKIRAKYLEALEEDDFEVLPGATFVKGFLRTYASFLKLDADSLVEEYRRTYEPKREDTAVVRTDISSRPRSRTSAERKKQRVRRGQRGYVLIGIIAVVVVALLAWFGSGRGQDPASIDASSLGTSSTTSSLAEVSSTTVSTAAGEETPASQNSSSSTTVTVENTTDTVTHSSSADSIELVVKVTRDSCWLVVREDNENGAEVYAGTLSAGGQQSFSGSKRYWLRVGKPEVLALTVNGSSVALGGDYGSFLVTEAGVESGQ